MEKIMELIDDLSKKLSRPIKDLDDVRQAMAALKEIRESEIFIDHSLGPVEVRRVERVKGNGEGEVYLFHAPLIFNLSAFFPPLFPL